MGKGQTVGTTGEPEEIDAQGEVEERLKISLTKMMKYNAKWDKENFPKFPDAVHWLRQLIALTCGVVCGVLPITGTVAIASFLFINIYIPYLYYTNYANVNIDDFGAQKLLFEGFQPSAAIFMLTWVLVYSSTQF